MNPDHLWAVIPAVIVVLLNVDVFASDAKRVTRYVLRRVQQWR